MSADGVYQIKPAFKYAESFAEGFAVVGDPDSGYWYIDRNGAQAIPGKFIFASPFFKGLAHVKFEGDHYMREISGTGTFAYIDRTGRRVFTYKP